MPHALAGAAARVTAQTSFGRFLLAGRPRAGSTETILPPWRSCPLPDHSAIGGVASKTETTTT